ncbi:MAG: PIN domain-containing protein [Chloroflexi bacterium]|nr:PIN domain-containing protein [Chloroflexota bacterium]
MAIFLDVSAILAAADTADLNHDAARAWFERVDEPLLVGALTLGEADHVLRRELGPAAAAALVAAVTSGAIRVVAPTEADLGRAVAILEGAAEHRPRLSDALLVAAAERLGVQRVATFDRRPLAVLAPRGPRGERTFDLEP